MKNAASIQTVALDLNTTEAGAPDWIQLTPAGPSIQGRDGRAWALTQPGDVIAAFNSNAGDLPVDYEHSTQIKGELGEPAPAVGWVKELAVRNNAIWARVEWTEEGRNAVASKSYRYVSPVFLSRKDTTEITRMMSVGLTNMPNLKLPALNRQAETGEPEMDKTILDALGLDEGADAPAVVTAINKLKTDEVAARNRADTPDPQKFVPKADHDLALNKLRGFEEAEKNRAEAEITTAVEAAIEAGKIAPSSKDYHIAACRTDGGLAAFNTMVEAAPEIAGDTGLGDKEPPKSTAGKLSDEELATCRALEITPEEFLAAKDEG